MTTKMNPEVKAKWLEALRSGEYEQGKQALRSSDDKFCCLGVLCDLAVKEGVIEEPTIPDDYDDDGPAVYGYESPYNPAGLGEGVIEWSGVESLGLLPTGEYLYRINDNGASFEEIADIIEKEL